MKLTASKVELFVKDLDASIAFYSRVLGFQVIERQPDGYTSLQNGAVSVALNDHDHLPQDHPVYIGAHDRPGRGVEFVFYTDDLPALYAQVQEQGWPVASTLARQPWGVDDFRLVDPDGYYLRISAR
jgi:lactoylglutathione lyase